MNVGWYLAVSALIFAAWMTSAHFLSSDLTTPSRCSGELATGSAVCSISLARTSGSCTTRAISLCILAITAGGVFAGANIAIQESTS